MLPIPIIGAIDLVEENNAGTIIITDNDEVRARYQGTFYYG
jgi:hypothetical protein